jgi:hypothetical protein
LPDINFLLSRKGYNLKMIMEKWNDEKVDLNKEKFRRGGIGRPLEKMMNKKYNPSCRIDGKVGQNDITFFTNENGDPISLNVGKRKDNGNISGMKYSRRIKKVENGKIVESHWDNQGKVMGKDEK